MVASARARQGGGHGRRVVAGVEDGGDAELAQPTLALLVGDATRPATRDAVAGEVAQGVAVQAAQVRGDHRDPGQPGRAGREELGDVGAAADQGEAGTSPRTSTNSASWRWVSAVGTLVTRRRPGTRDEGDLRAEVDVGDEVAHGRPRAP